MSGELRVAEDLITRPWYGYPHAGDPRRTTPCVIAVVHQTAAGGRAQQYRNTRSRSTQPSNTATYYVDPDGLAVHAVDGSHYASWCAGILNHPDTSIHTVAQMVADAARGYNPNEAVWEQFECVGSGAEPWTDAQFDTVARLIAIRSRLSGLPIDRTTVLAHRDLDTVNRPSDPWPASTREARMSRLIALARSYAGQEESDMDLSRLKPLARNVGVTAGSAIYDVLADGRNAPAPLGISVDGTMAVCAIADRVADATQKEMAYGDWPIAGGTARGWGGTDHLAEPLAYEKADVEAAAACATDTTKSDWKAAAIAAIEAL